MHNMTCVTVSSRRARAILGLLSAVLLVATAAAAEEVGTVASVRGAADIGRGGTQTAAVVGAPVELGDELHTGADGQLRVVFRDDSVIDLIASRHERRCVVQRRREGAGDARQRREVRTRAADRA